jgi:hypothetical protein
VPFSLQELNKLLPMRDSQDAADLDRPVQYQKVEEQLSEDEKQLCIKIAPLARPYISFGPDIRQHPCAMTAKTQQMCAMMSILTIVVLLLKKNKHHLLRVLHDNVQLFKNGNCSLSLNKHC